ncbi:MAG: hypothetical protein HWN69_03270 [Desulfobacterales bacterium]|nr:hypothetical protein [Desulfobacterales bacterium]
MGGTGDLWSATATESANITLMGMYQPTDGNYDQPSLFGVEIQSSDITTGAYSGYLGGVINEVVGAVYAVYIDPSQNAGILKGDFSGPTYPEIGMWEADGSIYRIVMESEDIGISPNELDVNLDEGIMVGWVSGDFGADDSELYSYLGWGSTLSISGHDDWGIFQLAFGYDNYAENPLSSTTWSARAGGFGEFGTHVGYGGFSKPDTGIWLTSLMTGDLDSPAEGMLTADFSGKYLTYAKYGDFTGEVIGTYDTNSWQAMAAGYWENGRDLKFNGVLDGDDLYTMRKEYHGHWDDGYGGSYYDYAYYEGDNAGWSCEYDASTETETHVSYNPDGTTETWWVDGYGGLYYEEGEYVDTVYDNVRIGPDGVIVEPDEVPSYYLGDNGWIDGFMGGLDDLWAATDINQAETRFIGEYESWWYDGATTPSVFTLGIQSYNPYHDNWTIWNQEDPTNPLSGDGAYYGFMGGRILGDDVAGGIMALYVDNSENAGILKGSFDGDVYPDLEMWDAAGSIYPIEMEPGISTIPEALYSNIDESGINFSGYGYGGGYLGVVVSEGESMSIAGQDWGIWNSMLGGYGGAESDWTLHLHNVVADPDEIHRLAEVEGYQSADGDITADVAGAWVNLTDAITGVMGGELIGTFDAEAFTYQAVAAGSWLETNRFLAMAGAPDGRDALAGLNIPCIEVGRTNLAGDNDDLTVNMNDVTFFSYSTGASPKIWATGDVNGTYNTLTPAPVNNLTGDNVGGFNASFTMNNMTETAPGSNIGNWDASVVGSGTISTHSINIQGAAAGDFGGVAEATTGDFNGTGAGVATPSPTD